MLYLMLTGEKAFPAETITAISFKVVHTEPVPARQINPGLPPAVDFILTRCLAKRPEMRYATAAELGADLRGLLATENAAGA
jgi:serine/threonine protein kinase